MVVQGHKTEKMFSQVFSNGRLGHLSLWRCSEITLLFNSFYKTWRQCNQLNQSHGYFRTKYKTFNSINCSKNWVMGTLLYFTRTNCSSWYSLIPHRRFRDKYSTSCSFPYMNTVAFVKSLERDLNNSDSLTVMPFLRGRPRWGTESDSGLYGPV